MKEKNFYCSVSVGRRQEGVSRATIEMSTTIYSNFLWSRADPDICIVELCFITRILRYCTEMDASVVSVTGGGW